jgi:hypothetical protein
VIQRHLRNPPADEKAVDDPGPHLVTAQTILQTRERTYLTGWMLAVGVIRALQKQPFTSM